MNRRRTSEGDVEAKARQRGEFRIHRRFTARALGNERPLAVYLPPNYSYDREHRYPVLYLHDGQNLFDAATAAFGVEWGADDTADRLIVGGRIRPIIIVGIYNTPDRIDEYTPHRDPHRNQGGRGLLYGRFVAEEVKPFIDHQYRTLSGREHTAIAGSSLGGLVSLAIAWQHRAVFGMCGALSPSLWWCEEEILTEFERDPTWPSATRFWVDMGTLEHGEPEESAAGVRRTKRLVACLERAGLVRDRDYRYWEVEGGHHNEAAWAARFDRVLLFFFGV